MVRALSSKILRKFRDFTKAMPPEDWRRRSSKAWEMQEMGWGKELSLPRGRFKSAALSTGAGPYPVPPTARKHRGT
jgi:hypothetical protein